MSIWNKIGVKTEKAEREKIKYMERIEKFKDRYNFLTQRRVKAESWMENINTKMEDIDKHLPTYYEIIIEISIMMQEYEKLTGEKMNDKELFEGFN